MACSNCTSTFTTNCTCDECTSCPVQLDTSCVLYHKDNAEISELDGLGLTNGATLELILEALDDKVKELNFSLFNLPVLRADYTINNLQQFAQSVDTALGLMASDVAAAVSGSTTPIVASTTSSIAINSTGTQGHTISASVRLSDIAGNLLSLQSDGLYVVPQTLSVNYVTKELAISGGNTISLASLASGASGYLGELASDPSAINGQYWYNTTDSLLKIKVNGTVKTIVTA